MGRIHLAAIAKEALVHQRLADIAQEFDYKYKTFSSVDEFSDVVTDNQVVMVVFSAISIANHQEISGHVQVIKQISPEAFVLVLVDKKISPDAVDFIKKSGANLILLENNFTETSQLEYLCSQIIRGSLVPIKATELKQDTTIDFHVMVMMPLNKKILPAASRGSVLSDRKIAKLLETKELYIQRDDLQKFQLYTETHQDRSAKGLTARCRIQYLKLCRAHAHLLTLLIDQSESSSFAQGKQLLDDCSALASDLLTSLASVEDPWSVVNNSSLGESGSAERSTSVAAMAGLLGLQLDGVKEDEVVLAALLCDFGMLDLPPATLKKIRRLGKASLSGEDLQNYHQHPIKSVNRCLSRKLPLPEKVKNIMMATHEKANGRGFPKQLPKDKIPLESQVIQFSEIVDEASLVKMGEERHSVQEIQKRIIQSELEQAQTFDLSFLQHTRHALNLK
jgi:hypothetical protein